MSISERNIRDELEEIGRRIKREMDASSPSITKPNLQSQMGRINNRGQVAVGLRPAGAVLNTVTPCAACKLLRRRCVEECPFSPYFSPHEPHKFAAVHKIFGASNVSKMLTEVAESERAEAANSLVYEANVRLRDPIYGCMGAISSLQRQLQSVQAELNSVRSHIFNFKFKFREQPPTTPPLVSVVAASSLPSNLHTPPPPSSTTAGGFTSISSDTVGYFA